MFTPRQYRAKATEYAELAKTAKGLNEVREFQNLERSFTMLADNEQWLADHRDQTVHAPAQDGVGSAALAARDEQVLRCLGTALIMQWNTLPRQLQRELFDNAGSVGDLLDVATLRGQIARFLHKHKDGGDEIADPAFVMRDEHAPTS